jgi:hypothetical protein
LKRRSEEGITLVEVMVIVLIVTILVAVAATTILKAQDRAKEKAAEQQQNGPAYVPSPDWQCADQYEKEALKHLQRLESKESGSYESFVLDAERVQTYLKLAEYARAHPPEGCTRETTTTTSYYTR